MKIAVKRLIRDEKGRAILLALILLGVGGLIITPLLAYMSTGLIAGEVYERKTDELYAADAGVEDAVWKIQHNADGVPQGFCDPPLAYNISDVNGKSVDVTIEYLGEGIFRITSIATGDDASSTTIVSYVEATYVEGTIEYDVIVEDGGTYEGTITDESVYGEGDLHVTGSIEEGAVVYVEGDMTVDGNIEDDAQVYVKGNLVLTGLVRPGNIEDTVIICVGGNLTLERCSEDGVEVYVEGNLTAGAIENSAKVCVEGSITVNKIENDPTVCAGGGLAAGKIEDGDIYAEGHKPFPDCPMCCTEDCRICCECPLEFTGGEGAGPGYWEAWQVTSYSINPTV